MTVGILGGSFNPIHRGHIALARQLLTAAALDEVWLMVSPQNPLKQDTDLLDDHLRLLMAHTALQHEPRLQASDFEFSLPRPSYTWNTLQALSEHHPQHRFALIIGADNWLIFHRWYRHHDILSHYPVIVYPRKDSPVDPSTLPTGVTLVNTRRHNVSSTEIRRRIRQGLPIDRLVPKSIVAMAEQYYKR